jgi:predicted nucleotidyltransferase
LGVVDYRRPLETIVPGVLGRVLGVLARTEAELTMRTVAQLADVSVNRAVTVLNELVLLGIVERREAGSSALVRLVQDNEAARWITQLGQLYERVVTRLEKEAGRIAPIPASVVLFGSFARGEAGSASDIDVLIVRPDDLSEGDDRWTDAVGRWTSRARRITGNPVNVVEVGASEVPRLLRRRGSVWSNIAEEGRVLAGADLQSLATGTRAS